MSFEIFGLWWTDEATGQPSRIIPFHPGAQVPALTIPLDFAQTGKDFVPITKERVQSDVDSTVFSHQAMSQRDASQSSNHDNVTIRIGTLLQQERIHASIKRRDIMLVCHVARKHP